MRCKLHDHVIAIAGPAAGASGTIVDVTPRWWRVFHGEDWLVEFPEPIPSYTEENELTTGDLVACADQDLLPVNPPADPEQIDTTSDIEVVS